MRNRCITAVKAFDLQTLVRLNILHALVSHHFKRVVAPLRINPHNFSLLNSLGIAAYVYRGVRRPPRSLECIEVAAGQFFDV